MNKLTVLTAAILIGLGIHQAAGGAGSATDIDPSENARNIAGITADTVILAAGRTFSFTVDSPADQGPVSTAVTADALPAQLKSRSGAAQTYRVTDKDGAVKTQGEVVSGDRLIVSSGNLNKTYQIDVRQGALAGRLQLEHDHITANTERSVTLYFTAGQRSPDATVSIEIPRGINVTMDNTTVNVIGRGDVKLSGLATQSIGRTGATYSYSKVGEVSLTPGPRGGQLLVFKHLDLRPLNRHDLVITINGVRVTQPGELMFRATYSTTQPDALTSAGVGPETATLAVVKTISDFARIQDKSPYRETPDTYTSAQFQWTGNGRVQLQQSLDEGRTWSAARGQINPAQSTVSVSGLQPNRLYAFRLSVEDGEHQGFSNPAWFYSGKREIKTFGVTGSGADDTDAINAAIDSIAKQGGGTLLFSDGTYRVRTVRMKSNVHLYIDKGATIRAIRGGDAPEPTWFSDRGYRSGTSPTDPGPYRDPENWLTKQDVGHTYFENSMFFAERMDNIKIIGNGRITGDGVLQTTDRVMDGDQRDRRSDKMFTFKLCTNIEIGGIHRDEDLWYDPEKDEPYYIAKDGSKDFNCDNMLQIDRGGHFVLLATGTDDIYVHNTYFGKHDGSNARDIYDFMACNNVTVINIYSKVSSDDIVKLGSDCSLGFTRPVSKCRVRNVIGDTNCNLFQIGSETADDITDVCVDNIYVLGSNKAGYSISTNDGATVKDVHLNCGHTGTIHSRSKMFRTRAPFFISISNRGRVIGAEAGRYVFHENGRDRNELLCKNVNIGRVENVILNAIDIYEVYAGSSYSNRTNRWRAFDGSQNRATPIVAGYALPDPGAVRGGLDFKLPNGNHVGRIQNIQFNDVHVLVKGGNPESDRAQSPPELGVGQYNVNDLRVQPSYGIWARHAADLVITNSTFNYEKPDERYALFLDDVIGARISSIKMVRTGNGPAIAVKNSPGVVVENAVIFNDTWDNAPSELPRINHTEASGLMAYPLNSR